MQPTGIQAINAAGSLHCDLEQLSCKQRELLARVERRDDVCDDKSPAWYVCSETLLFDNVRPSLACPQQYL